MDNSKLWGGRFRRPTAQEVDEFGASIYFDSRLYREDIEGSKAHALMLMKQGIISFEEGNAIILGLEEIKKEIEEGNFEFSLQNEDIHMNIESRLIQKIGEAGQKLHTARSRNDQVALDTRIYLKRETKEVKGLLVALMKTLLDVASQHIDSVMPGYTHLKKAQPVTLAHHLMAYFEMFRRDWERLNDAQKRMDFMPLGSGALAGTGLPIDRDEVRKELGFGHLTRNSMDAVSDRDFVIEFAAAVAILMMHLSRLSEEIVLWSTDEFGFLELDDAFSTGSSIMPQKKNPDVAELVRGKSGRVFGHLVALLTIMKGLPLTYNKDMQEDKEALFDTVDTVKQCLAIYTPMLKTCQFRTERMRDAARSGFTNATDLADYLVKKGMPFRQAHAVVGRIVSHCLDEGKALDEISLEEFKKFFPGIGEDVYQEIDIGQCVKKRNLPGGPAPEAVKRAIDEAYEFIKGVEAEL